MVVAIAKNGRGAIDLFDQQQPGHVVGEGHGREGELVMGRSFEFGCDAIG